MGLKQFLESAGTYVGVKYDDDSLKAIGELQKALGLKNPVALEDIHSTVLYSRVGIDLPSLGESRRRCTGVEIETWNTDNDKNPVVVLKIKSPELEERHLDLISIGGTHDFPDYTPHITLSYNDDVPNLVLWQPLWTSREYTEDLDINWVKDKE